MSDMAPEEQLVERRMNRADLLTGIVFTLLGLAIAYWSWIMPRLEVRGIHPATVPGLVPGLLGLALALCGIVLAWRAATNNQGARFADFFSVFKEPETGRFLIVVALALIYALVLVGLIPFWLATALFVFSFIFIFETWASSSPKPLPRAALWALVQAVIVAGLVTVVFENGFLVRLP